MNLFVFTAGVGFLRATNHHCRDFKQLKRRHIPTVGLQISQVTCTNLKHSSFIISLLLTCLETHFMLFSLTVVFNKLCVVEIRKPGANLGTYIFFASGPIKIEPFVVVWEMSADLLAWQPCRPPSDQRLTIKRAGSVVQIGSPIRKGW